MVSLMATTARGEVDLEEDLVTRLYEKTKANGDKVPDLARGWVITAARLAYRSQGRLLPKRRPTRDRAPRGEATPKAKLRWSQSDAQYAWCKQLIDDAGSSLTDVLREAVQAYLDADGDVVAMTWPPKSASRVAA